MNAVIVSAKRTAVGSFNGSLSTIEAPKLGATAIKAALESAYISPNDIDECIMGEVLTAGVGQAPARQAALLAGLPQKVPCLTINKVCGSGLKAVMLASDLIRLGEASTIVAGGQESMSLSPYLLEKVRTGYRMGSQTLVDSMIKDGLWDPGYNWHMGNAAELCVKEKNFTRDEQDQFSKESYEFALKAQRESLFKNEIVGVKTESKAGPTLIDQDEEPTKYQPDKMAKLKPAFEKDGTVTAANASKINDGGAAVVVMSDTKAKSLALKPLVKIVDYTTFAQDPKWFTTAPVGAVKKLLERTNLKTKDIDHWEINEAFAAVAMVAMKELGIDRKLVNPFGGAVAIGHPIGASGARILTTLVHGLTRNNARYGIATLCIGGGEAVAMLVENVRG
ncbi:MAG: acetyl-CoA acetyltransferase [Proteobacteria bacterium SG_bin7]|nr:MAG: acetyl-CoA acetyltransferase [Proteobacteria bacterium SG_bin7]